MPFTNPSFPGQLFRTMEEYRTAVAKRAAVEKNLANKSEEIVQVTATIVPAPKGLLEEKVVGLEGRIDDLSTLIETALLDRTRPPTTNKDGLKIGVVFQGESKGTKYTLEVLDKDYLCSDGSIYETLSGAAQGVSGNRRSGWKFWRDIEGNTVGNTSGRFRKDEVNNSLTA